MQTLPQQSCILFRVFVRHCCNTNPLALQATMFELWHSNENQYETGTNEHVYPRWTSSKTNVTANNNYRKLRKGNEMNVIKLCFTYKKNIWQKQNKNETVSKIVYIQLIRNKHIPNRRQFLFPPLAPITSGHLWRNTYMDVLQSSPYFLLKFWRVWISTTLKYSIYKIYMKLTKNYQVKY